MAARKSNGLSAEVADLLGNVLKHSEDAAVSQLRRHVRELFDDGMSVHDSFEDVLVGVYTAGMQAAIDARPKRTRKPGKQPTTSLQPTDP